MAWYNPATWTVVDNLQGQNRNKDYMNKVQSQDPNKVAGYINGRPYNFAGDWLGAAPSTTKAAPNKPAPAAPAEYVPRLPSYDTAAAWARAQAATESKVNPVYQGYLNNILAKYKAKNDRYKEENTRTKEDLDTNLNQYLEDSGLERTRTGEDTLGKIGEVNYQEGQFQDQEGDAFDQAVRSLRGDIAASGLTTSGIGQQAEQKATSDRNITSKDQLRTFENQRETQRIFQTRKFEDLDTGNLRTTQKTGLDKKRADEDLKYYLTQSELDLNVDKADLEVKRIQEINSRLNSAYQSEVNKFIASLVGRDPRDIALAKQIYG